MSRTVLVTGAAQGIGFEIARLFCESGYKVVVNYNRRSGPGLELEFLFPGMAYAIRADISDPDLVLQMVQTANELFGGVDILVNNAGVSLWQMFGESNEQDFARLFDVNVRGAFSLCQAVLPYMIKQKYGRIINISSIWGQVGASCEVLYSSSKAAVDGFSKALAKEVGPSGITVNSVAPGLINTEMNASLCEDSLQTLIDQTPLHRLGTPNDVANLVLFLASDQASFITGQIIGVNGGLVIV